MSSAYKILLERSVFSRDNRPAPVVHPVPTTQATVVESASPGAEAEANFVLTGVSFEDESPTAFFEQTSEKRFVRKHSGEPLSHGTVNAISLDGIEYAANGKSTHILIGQTLDGGVAVVTTSAPSTATTSSNTSASTEKPAGEKPSWWRKSKDKEKDSSSSSGKHKKDRDPNYKSSKKSDGF
jgi:hypothetical protein